MSTAFPVTWLDFSGVFTCTERHGHWCSTSNSAWPAEQRAPRPRGRRGVGQHEFAQMGLPLTGPRTASTRWRRPSNSCRGSGADQQNGNASLPSVPPLMTLPSQDGPGLSVRGSDSGSSTFLARRRLHRHGDRPGSIVSATTTWCERRWCQLPEATASRERVAKMPTASHNCDAGRSTPLQH